MRWTTFPSASSCSVHGVRFFCSRIVMFLSKGATEIVPHTDLLGEPASQCNQPSSPFSTLQCKVPRRVLNYFFPPFFLFIYFLSCSCWLTRTLYASTIRHLEQAVFPKCKGMRSGDGTEIRCPDCGWICLKHMYEKHKGCEECKSSYAWRKQMVELEKIRNRPRTAITLLAADGSRVPLEWERVHLLGEGHFRR